ncbi:hypothetical protein [Nocardia sp. CA-290969]|uniref:hypothetical protein n=1 Tax=Nocardia sp. CA-290969 TaxID=3239986 RepID=UPI003D9006CA
MRLGSRLTPRALLVPGALVTTAGLGWFACMTPDGSYRTDALGPCVIAGFALSLAAAAVLFLAAAAVAATLLPGRTAVAPDRTDLPAPAGAK